MPSSPEEELLSEESLSGPEQEGKHSTLERSVLLCLLATQEVGANRKHRSKTKL